MIFLEDEEPKPLKIFIGQADKFSDLFNVVIPLNVMVDFVANFNSHDQIHLTTTDYSNSFLIIAASLDEENRLYLHLEDTEESERMFEFINVESEIVGYCSLSGQPLKIQDKKTVISKLNILSIRVTL